MKQGRNYLKKTLLKSTRIPIWKYSKYKQFIHFIVGILNNFILRGLQNHLEINHTCMNRKFSNYHLRWFTWWWWFPNTFFWINSTSDEFINKVYLTYIMNPFIIKSMHNEQWSIIIGCSSNFHHLSTITLKLFDENYDSFNKLNVSYIEWTVYRFLIYTFQFFLFIEYDQTTPVTSVSD